MSRSRSNSRECDTNVPSKLIPKACTQVGMAGHKSEEHPQMINDVHGNDVFCAKLLPPDNRRELIFYKDIYELINSKKINNYDRLGKFLPKVEDQCEYNNDEYMVIENIFSSLGDDFKFVDLKIGPKTSFSQESGRIKSMKHIILDKYRSTSEKYGFRVEGGNIDLPGYSTKQQKQNMIPSELWAWFFNGVPKIKEKFIEKLFILKDILSENMDPRTNPKWGSVGTSILAAHNNNRLIVKLIDFGHGYIYPPSVKERASKTYQNLGRLRGEKYKEMVQEMSENNYIGICEMLNSLLTEKEQYICRS